MNKEKYLSRVENQLRQIFQASKEGYKNSAEKHRLEGFMQAGVIVGLVTNTELNTLMEDVHLTVFGKTIKQRKEERSIHFDDETIDYSGYEQPTFERKDS